VALDACTDYQRNGVRFLAASELLHNPQAMAWGGLHCNEAARLKYRIAKAAAKGKNRDAVHCEIMGYSADALNACDEWLRDRWDITAHDWSAEGITDVLEQLRSECRPRPRIFAPGVLIRIASRVIKPSGLFVNAEPATSMHLAAQFGRVHFRHVVNTASLRPNHVLRLIRSSLILIDYHPWMERLMPRSWALDLTGIFDPHAASIRLAELLNQRCLEREGLARVSSGSGRDAEYTTNQL
jgi:hypothetical protein